EERARHVRDRADAGVAIAELLGVGLEIRQELFQILSRHVLLRYDRLWREVADADLLEARGRIVLEGRVERGRGRLRAHVADADGVAVRGRLRDAGHAGGAAGAADVLHHQLLP